MKLFRVTCRGMHRGDSHGIAYAVAKNADDAYQLVRADLDKRDLGFLDEREMEKVELIAEATNYPRCKCKLYVSKKEGAQNEAD